MSQTSVSLRTQIGQVQLKNPVMPASGTFDCHNAPALPFDAATLGAIVVKSVTLHPQKGNPPARLAETPSGLINSIGIPSPGIDVFIQQILPTYTALGSPVIVSVAGYSANEYAQLVAALDGQPSVAAIELNLSCPNIRYHRMPAQDKDLLQECVAMARGATAKPLWAKLSPDVPSVGEMAQAAEVAGADACTVINTTSAMMVNIHTLRPMIGATRGGLSGPALLPIALAAVWDATHHANIPVIGVGGISTVEDVIAVFAAGASAVQIGTASFYDPMAMPRLIGELDHYLKDKGIASIEELKAKVRQMRTHSAEEV
ncbi:dihydroorotate dehydrogenase [Sulfobacillus sp. hq2]|uniref:dihydroorotate dehydrogenase n=1 Tax=Sulfobacillus TaxID=28033 RepID=UPI000CD23C7F|nr:dihydroorotate dehydrogenase [Sulfobacillus sp. hq2]POB10074.1 dihydroorotate dehydrogenase B catalytic subunit [Sulfobacillus sp. hq2]